ncbi:MAG: GAF domain-containing protein [Bacteroidales bacterium]|jgi:GAF domain-containing protein|nr:GAF domain-containing protein [Bacteroidales bacterium]MDD2569894.1 GAF domain-containing protein [Bacteroidales bacterium]MDD2812819.1 GAF domain-containing protein [Bacteroidales bacterium]MDD3385041.1 GAF domain-containing protein [Bacteroidales bacterium]MDD3811246.1 GAF domain-containing protein [Bacteroidales bacterium]
MMNKSGRYNRLYDQIRQLLLKCENPVARMATICAVLHHKMPKFFWTGFYLLTDQRLIVSVYQGPVACMELRRDKGVCWASIQSGETIIVPDVNQFPDHIACDARSKSEIVVPLRNGALEIMGVLDVDSTETNAFDQTDAIWLEKITDLIYNVNNR